MGAVYKAFDLRLLSTVALKQTLVTGEQLSRAFTREAQLLARMRHPVLPKVMDYFSDDMGQFLVMEFIPGKDLGDLLEERAGKPFPLADVMQWAQNLLGALDYLHSQTPPIVHRDIKPENLKLTPEGDIILLDFGLAKGSVAQQTKLTTNTRSVFGYTLQYAPPEQIEGAGTDARSDLFSLGATLYLLMTGTQPAAVLSRTAALARRQPDPLVPAHKAHSQVPPGVSVVLSKAMEMDPQRRYASAKAMWQALEQAPTKKSLPMPALPAWAWGVVSVGAILVIALVVLVVLFGGGPEQVAEAPPSPTATTAASAISNPESASDSEAASEADPTDEPTPIPTATEPPVATSTPLPAAPEIDPLTEPVYIGDINASTEPVTFTVQGQGLAQFADAERVLISRADNPNFNAVTVVEASENELTLALNQVPEPPEGEQEYQIELEAEERINFTVSLRDFLREATVQGVDTEYDYTNRVATDEQGPFTRMRQQSNVASEHGAVLRNGDVLQILSDEVDGWYQARVVESSVPAETGQVWWIERWLVDDENIPPPPTATPIPPTAPPAPVVQPTAVPPPPPQPEPEPQPGGELPF